MKKLLKFDSVEEPDSDPDVSYLDNFPERKAEYYNQGFYHVGIYAVAEVSVNGIWQKLKSSGLWGIESDSDEEYFDSVRSQEIGELMSILIELGFDKDEVQKEALAASP